ncbi:MAG: hypothetical protein QOH88_3194 [Verrucomicrobiota bacterium]|jgi:hypothetical protein
MTLVRANPGAALRTAETSANEFVSMDDWVQYLRSNEGKLGDELDLSQLQPGDLLRIVTLHSEYFLTIEKGREATLVCPQAGRPAGPVSIMGCTFGLSSSIKPDHLFCGGNLELNYQLEGVAMTHTTTTIKEIYLQRQEKSVAPR